MKLEDLTWLAGLWEGEGSFFVDMQKRKGVRYPYAIAQISMTDEDIIERVSELLDKNYTLNDWFQSKNPDHKVQFRLKLSGDKAIDLMRNLYRFMGARRQQKIIDVLT